MLKLYSFNYSLLLSFIVLALLITIVLAAVSIGLSWNSTAGGAEVSNAYECGFLPFDRARTAFDVRFFLVGLLFLLFDLEVVVLLPIIPIVYNFTLIQFGCFCGFVAVLGLCFTFELLRHALDF